MKQNFERKLENLKELLLNPQNVQRKVYENATELFRCWLNRKK